MKISVSALRTVEKNGGLDEFLIKTSNRILAPEAVSVKKSILKHINKDEQTS